MKKKICVVISVILSVLLCVCLIYNLIGGAPSDHESVTRYIVSTIGFSVVLSGIFGNFVFRTLSIESPGKKTEDDLCQISLSKLVSAYESGKLTESEKEELRSLLNDMEK